MKFHDTWVHLTACCFLLGFLSLILQSRHFSSFSCVNSNTCHFFPFWIVIFLAKSWTAFLRGQMSVWPDWENLGAVGLPLLTRAGPSISSGVSQSPPQAVFWQTLKAAASSSPATSCPRQLIPSHVPVLESLAWSVWIEMRNWNDLLMSLKKK